MKKTMWEKVYTPGNIVYISYWRAYDLILARTDFMVIVIRCDKDGNPLKGHSVREHFTHPDRSDKIVGFKPFWRGELTRVEAA